MHRIGRAGRFGDLGLAITILESNEEEKVFWEINQHYKMDLKVTCLKEGPKQFGTLLNQMMAQ